MARSVWARCGSRPRIILVLSLRQSGIGNSFSVMRAPSGALWSRPAPGMRSAVGQMATTNAVTAYSSSAFFSS
ncbi:hypothetical protein GCM10023080_058190 [Streptomyces pseudoechinosporeus]